MIKVKCHKFQTMKIQNGGRQPSRKSLYRYISVQYHELFYAVADQNYPVRLSVRPGRASDFSKEISNLDLVET